MLPESDESIYDAMATAGKFKEILELTSNEDSQEAKYWEISALFRLGEVQKSLRKLNEYRTTFISRTWEMRLCNLQSAIYKNIGDFESALISANKCILMTEVIQTQDCIENRGLAFSNIAEVYRILGNVEKSLEYYFQGYQLYQIQGVTHEIEIFILNIGIAYRSLGDLEKAEKFLQENYQIATSKGNPQYLTYSLVELIELEVRRNIAKANAYLKELHEISDANSSNKRIALHGKYATALVYKFSPRAREKVKGGMLLEELVEYNDIEIYYTLEAIPHLIELLLIEYANFHQDPVLHDIDKYLSLLYNLGTKANMNQYIIKSLIIQAKLKQIKGDIHEANLLLEDAEGIAKKYELTHLIEEVSEVRQGLLKDYDTMKQMVHENAAFLQKWELSGLVDYLRKIQGVVKKD